MSFLTASLIPRKKRFTSAVIVAAGESSRFAKDGVLSKQLQSIAGIPVVVHSMLAFERCPLINEIVVAARENDIELYDEFKVKYGISKLTRIVRGGIARQESALAGFDAISDKADFVAIHDGARCLVTPQIIEDVARAAFSCGAAAAACVSTDTVKIVDASGYVDKTLDRNTVRMMQTPQIFAANLYRAAAYSAKEEGFVATDDCMLAERAGFKVKLVDCSPDNIKITHPGDIEIAEAIYRGRNASLCE